jgi:putative transposase
MALYIRMRTHNFTGLDVISFLRHLFKHLRGPIVLLWDRGTIHTRVAVRDFLKSRGRVRVEWFPAYAPELNPAEHVWNQTDSALANGAPLHCRQLAWRLHNTIRRIRGSQKLLWSCIYASDLPWAR